MAAPQIALILLLTAAPEVPSVDATERARSFAREGRWAEAARTLSAVDASTAPADVLVLLTRAVLESGDLRRARLLGERGLLRFPDDIRFRRLDLAVLIERRQWSEAAAAARSILSKQPEDPIAWRQLAAATIAGDDEAQQRAVLEAAHLAAPDDPVLFEKHVRAQFLAQHLETAVALAEDALKRPTLADNRAFIRLAVRVAEAAGRRTLARQWLKRIPPAARDTPLTLLEARLAMADDDPKAAEAAFRRLIDKGEASPSVLIRAGQMAEDRQDWGRAETLYAQAAEGDGPSAPLAQLFRARLLAKIGDRTRAARLLRTYLTERPADAYARQLLGVIQANER